MGRTRSEPDHQQAGTSEEQPLDETLGSFYEEALRSSALAMATPERIPKEEPTETATVPQGESSEDDEVQQDEERRQGSNRSLQQASTGSPSVRAARAIRRRQYSLAELVQCLNSDFDSTTLPPDLYRRVMDYRLAQQKRLQKYGPTQKWGIYGVFLHLSNVRTDLEWAEDAAYRREHGQPYLSWSDYDAWKRRQVRPYFTYALTAVCTVLLLVEFAVNDWTLEPLDVNPLLGPSAETLIQLGALDTPKIVNDGEWFRLFSPLILHAGIVHYLVNMGALWFFGGALEQSLAGGWYSAAFLFFVPGVGGNLLSAVFLPQYISVGASGGIFGYIGACLADIMLHWNLIFLKDCQDTSDRSMWKRNFWAFFWLAVEVVVNILLGMTPFIDNFIHLGGFFYGILCGWSVIEYAALNFLGYNASVWTKLRMFTLRFLGLLASVIFIIITASLLATLNLDDGGAATCPNCRYFNCVPFPSAQNPWWHCDDCNLATANLFRTETNTTNFYTRVDLTCPDGDTVETIDVADRNISNRNVMIDQLPDYCREYCENVYSNRRRI